MEPVNLDAKRKSKEPKCMLCGGPLHDYIGQCRRLASVTQEIDGSETYHLHPIEDEPPDAA